MPEPELQKQKRFNNSELMGLVFEIPLWAVFVYLVRALGEKWLVTLRKYAAISKFQAAICSSH